MLAVTSVVVLEASGRFAKLVNAPDYHTSSTSEKRAMTEWATVIMAAGAGSRMHSRTPKVLHAVAGRTMLRCVLDAATAAGPSRQIVVIPPDSEAIEAEAGPAASIAVQSVANGTAGAVRTAETAAGRADHVLILNGDLPLIESETLCALRQQHEQSQSVLSLLTAVTPKSRGLARIQRSDGGAPIAIVEERDAPPICSIHRRSMPVSTVLMRRGSGRTSV